MNKFLFSLFSLLLLVSHASFAQQTVVMIRHAEKIITTDKDPALTNIGIARANGLVELFSTAKPTAIYTTQYQRTQLTAKPLSDAINIPITVLEINADNLAQYPALLLKQICALPNNATVLVVGHSNSIPDILEAWSHEPVKAIADDEYNRIFIVNFEKCKATQRLDLRY
jgi:broad specificity phosphatase PhoE